jgi:arginase
MTRNISIIGAPFNGGQPKAGVDRAPAVLREAGLTSTLTKAGWQVSKHCHSEISYLIVISLNLCNY